jgi:nucleoside-diphosphate-sugar epimerase
MSAGDVLITGATGFIGSHLADELLARGRHVSCLLRRTSDRRWLDSKPLRLVEGELLGNAELSRIVDGQEVVYHVAGAVRAPDEETFLRVNARATEELLTACLAATSRPRRVVLVSSVAACGAPPPGETLTERQAPAPVTAYGRSKRAGEERALAFKDRIEIVIVRPTVVYGPRDREVLPLLKLARRGFLPVFGGRDQVLNLCHGADIALGTALAGEANVPSGSIYLLGDSRNYPIAELTQIFGSVVGRRVRALYVPRALLRSAAWSAGTWARIRGRAAMLCPQKVPELTASWPLSIEAARRDLGYEPPRELAVRLAETVRWYEEEGAL